MSSGINYNLIENFKEARMLLCSMLAVENVDHAKWFADPTCLVAFNDMLSTRVPDVISNVEVANVAESVFGYQIPPFQYFNDSPSGSDERRALFGEMRHNITTPEELLSAVRFAYGANSPGSLLATKVSEAKRYRYTCNWCKDDPSNGLFKFSACRFSADEDPKFFDHKCKVGVPKKERSKDQWDIQELHEYLKSTIFTLSDPPAGYDFLAKVDQPAEDRVAAPDDCSSLTDALVWSFIDATKATFDVLLDTRDHRDPDERVPLIVHLIDKDKVPDRRDKTKSHFKLSALPGVVVDIPKSGCDIVVPQFDILLAMLYCVFYGSDELYGMIRSQIECRVLIHSHPAFQRASGCSHPIWTENFTNAFKHVIKGGSGERALDYPGNQIKSSSIASNSLWSVVANVATAVRVFDDICEGTRECIRQLAHDTGRNIAEKTFEYEFGRLSWMSQDLCKLVTGPLRAFSVARKSDDFTPAPLLRGGPCIFVPYTGQNALVFDRKMSRNECYITAEIRLMSSNWRILQGDRDADDWINGIFQVWMKSYSLRSYGKLTDNKILTGTRCALKDLTHYSWHHCLNGRGNDRREEFIKVGDNGLIRGGHVRTHLSTFTDIALNDEDNCQRLLARLCVNDWFIDRPCSVCARGFSEPTSALANFEAAWIHTSRKWGDKPKVDKGKEKEEEIEEVLMSKPIYIIPNELRSHPSMKKARCVSLVDVIAYVPGARSEYMNLSSTGSSSLADDVLVRHVQFIGEKRLDGKTLTCDRISVASRLSSNVIVVLMDFKQHLEFLETRRLPTEDFLRKRFELEREAGLMNLKVVDHI
jgi:hypothetical protein